MSEHVCRNKDDFISLARFYYLLLSTKLWPGTKMIHRIKKLSIEVFQYLFSIAKEGRVSDFGVEMRGYRNMKLRR